MSDTIFRIPALWLVIALCPALAVSDLGVSALGLGIVVLITSLFMAGVIAACRSLPLQQRWMLSSLALAAWISAVGLMMNAWTHELFGSLGIFLPLLAASLAFQPLVAGTAVDALRRGAVFLLVLVLLGGVRELVGRGSLLHDGALIIGMWPLPPEHAVFRADMGFLLAMLPPGAFIALGLLLAARNWIAQRRHG